MFNFTKKRMDPQLGLFAKEMRKAPGAVGAVWPSSRRLSCYMARQISIKRPGYIIELGPGTGVVTQAMLDRAIDPKKIILIEQSEGFAQFLTEKFPDIQVIQGDATCLGDLIPKECTPINAIVSSLPFRSLPAAAVEKLIQQLSQVMDPECVFIQFSYLSFDSHPLRRLGGLTPVRTKRIWFNLPPAEVCTFQYQPAPGFSK